MADTRNGEAVFSGRENAVENTTKLPSVFDGVSVRRGKHQGTLQRSGKKWGVRWMMDGKRYFWNTGETDRKKAEEKARDHLNALAFHDERMALRTVEAQLKSVDDREADAACIALDAEAIFKRFAASPDMSDTGKDSLSEYHSKLTRFVSWAAKNAPEVKTMRDVARNHVDRFMVESISGEFSNNTYNKYAVMLSHIWRTLADEFKLVCNPWTSVKRKKLKTHKRRELTIKEVSSVIDSISGELRTLFLIGVYTGLRLKDCALLKWDGVDMVNRVIFHVPKKTSGYGIKVSIPIHDCLYDELAGVPVSRRVGFVLPGIAKQYNADPVKVVHMTSGAFRSCGIVTNSKHEGERGNNRVDVGFHSLRHTFVSLAANAGVSLAVVQSIVGHTSADMTRHYFHENEISLRSAVNAVPSFNCVEDSTVDSVDALKNVSVEEVITMIDGLGFEDVRKVIAHAKERMADLA